MKAEPIITTKPIAPLSIESKPGEQNSDQLADSKIQLTPMRKMIIEARAAAKMGLDFLSQQHLIVPVLAQDQTPEILLEHDKQVILPGVKQPQSTSLAVIPEKLKTYPIVNARYISNAEQTRSNKFKPSYLEYSEKLPQLGAVKKNCVLCFQKILLFQYNMDLI